MSKVRENGSKVSVKDYSGNRKEGVVIGTGTKYGSNNIPYTANTVQYADGSSELVCTEESGGPGNSRIEREGDGGGSSSSSGSGSGGVPYSGYRIDFSGGGGY